MEITSRLQLHYYLKSRKFTFLEKKGGIWYYHSALTGKSFSISTCENEDPKLLLDEILSELNNQNLDCEIPRYTNYITWLQLNN